MSEWDQDELSESGKSGNQHKTGAWDVVLTITVLISVTAVSFLVSFLTKDIISRPFWMLALCFACPVAALILTAFLKEKCIPTMTPSSSRKAQFGLALGCIAAACVVGCFCQFSNEKTTVVETVQTKSDVLIILDKSGSMLIGNRNEAATKAVVDLVKGMDDSVQVGLLIDVGWKENNDPSDVVPLEKRRIDIAPLSEQRDQIIRMARCEPVVNENFPMAFKVACEMVREYKGTPGNLSIIIISDGEDCTEEFRAADFSDELNRANVKVNYLYVDSNYSPEMELLSRETSGQSIYVANLDELTGKMNGLTTVPKTVTYYKDALRSIDESAKAKTVTGILLLLLGVLIGFTLTVMFSVQGQKRFQMILSPLMAVISFLLLIMGKELIPTAWIREAIAFSLLGIVIMRKNGDFIQSAVKTRGAEESLAAAGETSDTDLSGDSW